MVVAVKKSQINPTIRLVIYSFLLEMLNSSIHVVIVFTIDFLVLYFSEDRTLKKKKLIVVV